MAPSRNPVLATAVSLLALLPGLQAFTIPPHILAALQSTKRETTPFKVPPIAPISWNTDTPESVNEAAQGICDSYTKFLDDLVAKVSVKNATFENFVLAQTAMDDSVDSLISRITFYSDVSPDAKVRDASNDAGQTLSQCYTELGMRQDVFDRLKAVYEANKKKLQGIDKVDFRLLEKMYNGSIASGLGIEKQADRDRFKEIEFRLAELGSEFSRNFNEESGGLWVTEEELDGCPSDYIARLEKGEGENKGLFRITNKGPDATPFLQYAKNETARLRYYVPYQNRLIQNVPILKETIILRDERARILGFSSHAEARLQSRMAKTPQTVDAFLDDLRTRLGPAAKKDLAALLSYKEADYKTRDKEFDGNIYSWETAYYESIMIQKEFTIDQVKLSEYFPASTMLDKIFAIYSTIFGFTFTHITKEDEKKLNLDGDLAWHPDVVTYAVWDKDSFGKDDTQFRGYLYLDLFPRQGKQSHAYMSGLEIGHLNGTTSNTLRTSLAIVTNLAPPTETKPALLLHSDVVTLFHELGHAMHALSSRAKYSGLSALSVARDFVEAPSQMLEEWFWTKSVLQSVSSHYETGEAMPDDMIDRLIATKHVNAALGNMRQLQIGIFDMIMHEGKSHQEIVDLDLSPVYNQLGSDLTGIKTPHDFDPKTYNSSWGNSEASITHYMSGYDAGYYGYLWSQVYAFDMYYTNFKANPMSPVEGLRYRHAVLEKVGTQDEEETLEAYMGRKISSDAFFEDMGLSGETIEECNKGY